MIIRRVRRQRFANPLTGLPGSVIIEQRVASAFESGDLFALCHVDIDRFKAYNDRYGYPRGDELIAHVARLVADAAGYSGRVGAAQEQPDPEGVLVGHVSGDDFVFVSPAAKARKIAESIVERFDATIPEFYEPEDREKGYITVKDRRGNERREPFLTVSVAIVSTERRTFWSPIEITDTAAELKAYAKSLDGSVVVEDRRESSTEETAAAGSSD